MSGIVRNKARLGRFDCGNCGHERWRMYHREKDIRVECIGCGSSSYIQPTEPKFTIQWGDNPQVDKGLPSVFNLASKEDV